jgi:hypothetical protein
MSDPTKHCTTCNKALVYAGTKSFRTGGSSGLTTFFLGQWAQSDEDLLPLALYGCTACGRIEFFLPPQ